MNENTMEDSYDRAQDLKRSNYMSKLGFCRNKVSLLFRVIWRVVFLQ